MSRRSLQVFDQYHYGPRSVLVPGDRFRASGGPVYVTDDGAGFPLRIAASSCSGATASKGRPAGLRLPGRRRRRGHPLGRQDLSQPYYRPISAAGRTASPARSARRKRQSQSCRRAHSGTDAKEPMTTCAKS